MFANVAVRKCRLSSLAFIPLNNKNKWLVGLFIHSQPVKKFFCLRSGLGESIYFLLFCIFL
ncbi:unnamed protein product [Meloidogyne enterolobii]|uniref:Uncharacterized protein n=1 Tax=Meloidogyne enterolobii TaxID=390850 RepID=A0ACB1AY18_MELEN